MQDKKLLHYAFDEYIIGKPSSFNKQESYFYFRNKKETEENVFEICRYAIRTYSGLKMDELKDGLTEERLEALRLTKLLKKISYPPEVKDKKLAYLLNCFYPEIYPFDFAECVAKYYEKLLESKHQNFPDIYFDRQAGRERVCICLNHLIRTRLSYESIDQLYELFSKKKIHTFLKKYKLYTLCYHHFTLSVDFLHESLADSQKNEFLHHYYLFESEFKKEVRKREAES